MSQSGHGAGRLPIAVFVDVDGTLAGPYRGGKRELRASACEVLAMLAKVAPVFLWSVVGAENGTRLLREYPELRPHVTGSHGKADFPLDTVDTPFAIDDELLDEAVLRCRHFVLDTSYFGGVEESDLRRAASAVVEEIVQLSGRVRR
jgi:hypothetical protein